MRTKTNIAAAAIVLLAGCASSGTKVTEAQAGQFTKGQSTETQVIAALGAPSSSTRAADGSRTDVYVYTHAQARAASFIPIVGALAGGADATTTMVSFHFSPEGILRDWTSTAANAGVNTGLLNQK